MRIAWGVDVRRKLRTLSRSDVDAIVVGVERFASGAASAPATGSLFRRLRVGTYRVVMVLAPDGAIVWVVRLYRVDR